MYLDALVVKVKESNQVRNKAAASNMCSGFGRKPAKAPVSGLGCSPSSATAVSPDVLIACVDGLTGFPEAIEATFPNTVLQTWIMNRRAQ
jgi:putative transposase